MLCCQDPPLHLAIDACKRFNHVHRGTNGKYFAASVSNQNGKQSDPHRFTVTSFANVVAKPGLAIFSRPTFWNAPQDHPRCPDTHEDSTSSDILTST